MPIYDTFAKRKKRALDQDKPIIYRYDDLPRALRVQVVHIWRGSIGGPWGDGLTEGQQRAKLSWWQSIHDTLAKEIGVFDLVDGKSITK